MYKKKSRTRIAKPDDIYLDFPGHFANSCHLSAIFQIFVVLIVCSLRMSEICIKIIFSEGEDRPGSGETSIGHLAAAAAQKDRD